MHRDETRRILSEDEIALIVRKTISEPIFTLTKYAIQPVSDAPTGFLGEHLRLKATVALGKESRELQYFVKRMPLAVPEHVEYARTVRAFYKEIELYKTLFVDLKLAQKNRVKWCPEYYYSRSDELIVIEDLSPLGYCMLPERTLMDEDHVKASLTALAAMHAASIVFENKFGRGLMDTSSPHYKNSGTIGVEIGDVYSHLTFETEASGEKGHPGNTFYEAGIKGQISIVDLLSNYSDHEKKLIKEKLPDVLKRIFHLVKPSDKYKNVFIHGDLWANNLLFRKNEETVLEAVIIDFQLARYAPPAHDVMMLLYMVQDNGFRSRKQTKLLHFYYDVLEKELAADGILAESVLPRTTFLESCKHYEELGFLSAVLYYQLILAPSDITGRFMASQNAFADFFLVDRSEMVTECFRKDEIFRQRMTEAMDEVIRRCILIPGTAP